jgi:hypothetical protein
MKRLTVLLAALGLALVGTIQLSNAPRQVLAQVRAALVRDLDNPARLPVVLTTFVSIPVGGTEGTGHFTICWEAGCSNLVPSIYRLVIEYISVNGAAVPEDAFYLAEVISTVNNQRVGSYLSLQPVHTLVPTSVSYNGGSLVRIYADPSSDVDAHFVRSNEQGERRYKISGYGHFVSVN